MKYKIGEILYSCYLEDGKRPSYSKWKIRTKRSGKFYAIMINDYTWVKHQWGQPRDFAKAIPDYCRDSCKVGDKFRDLFRTKKQSRDI